MANGVTGAYGVGRLELSARLSLVRARVLSPAHRVRAAVAVVVLGETTEMQGVVLIERAGTLRSFPSQLGLPGGRVDAGESSLEAVMREVHEELGLRLQEGDLLGRLDDVVLDTYVLTPFVFWADAEMSDLALNEGEVARAFLVPPIELDVQAVEIDDATGKQHLRWPYAGDLIHAPTATILYQFSQLAFHNLRARLAPDGTIPG